MARLLLKDNVSSETLGEAVLKIAENTGGQAGALSAAAISRNQQDVAALFKDPFSSKINLVYDSADEIHIVIPFLGGKVYSGNKLAHEAMGSIVIMGCAS